MTVEALRAFSSIRSSACLASLSTGLASVISTLIGSGGTSIGVVSICNRGCSEFQTIRFGATITFDVQVERGPTNIKVANTAVIFVAIELSYDIIALFVGSELHRIPPTQSRLRIESNLNFRNPGGSEGEGLGIHPINAVGMLCFNSGGCQGVNNIGILTSNNKARILAAFPGNNLVVFRFAFVTLVDSTTAAFLTAGGTVTTSGRSFLVGPFRAGIIALTITQHLTGWAIFCMGKRCQGQNKNGSNKKFVDHCRC
mmetsp:Transcript_65507/g.75355  ORF Transcript_65507/g.75355 Transcript_65507/m.75355 type:complete len:256 (+) Transcript_65507:979-1746(+)